MPVSTGARFGPYEIIASLGAGGMGEVYRARDTRLGREVALKVLPEAFAHEPDRLARFEREAKLLASLNHPNIAALYGVEREGDRLCLAIELVEGESLADRLRRGPLPLDEAVEVAAQVASALEAAHEAGVIHRDLKPGNVMVRTDGVAKVLDFGLARGSAGSASTGNLSQSPTMTAPGTLAGVILGTAAYMSPEQAKGKAVDRRADLWAWGCLLYECLSGRRAFEGEDVSETLAAILKIEADWSALPSEVPQGVRDLLHRCLRKDPRERLRDAGDARLLLLDARRDGAVAVAGPPVRRAPSWLWIAAPLVLIAAWGVGRWITPVDRGRPASGPRQVQIALTDSLALSGWASPVLAFAPDGRSLAYAAVGPDGMSRAYVHDLDNGQIRRVPGSESAEGPFFSPDGQWLAFAIGVSGASQIPKELRKYSLRTGLTQTICSLKDYFGGFWERDEIVWSDEVPGPLLRIHAGGGTPEPLIERSALAESVLAMAWPQPLPGGPFLLVTNWGRPDRNTLGVLDRRTGKYRDLGVVSSFGRYVQGGYLLYNDLDGRIMAVRFDPGRGQIKGQPVAVLSGVSISGNEAAVVAVSPQGHLAWSTGRLRLSRFENVRLVRVTAGDSARTLPIEPDLYGPNLSASRDGSRLFITSMNAGPWVVDMARGSRARLPLPRGVQSGYWMPDGRELVFSQAGAPYRIGVIDPAGGEPRWVGQLQQELILCGVTPDARRALFTIAVGGGLRSVALDGTGDIAPVVPGAGISSVSLSPDGRWVAYVRNAGGGNEVFVDRVGGGQAIQVSLSGGVGPRWSRDGRELYFGVRGRFHAVEFTPGDPPRISHPVEFAAVTGVLNYDVLPGRRELVVVQRPPNEGFIRSLHLALNWSSELEDLLRESGKVVEAAR